MRLILALLRSHYRRGSGMLRKLRIRMRLEVLTSSIPRLIARYSSDRSQRTRLVMLPLHTLGVFMRWFWVTKMLLCSVVGAFDEVPITVRGRGGERVCKVNAVERWETSSSLIYRSYGKFKRRIACPNFYALCGMFMLCPSIVDWNFAVLKILSTCFIL